MSESPKRAEVLLRFGRDQTLKIRRRMESHARGIAKHMLSEPMMRRLDFSADYLQQEKLFDARKPKQSLGAAVYMTGVDQTRPCEPCATRPGVFETCVVRENVAEAVCASCIYRGCRTKCNYHSNSKHALLLSWKALWADRWFEGVERRRGHFTPDTKHAHGPVFFPGLDEGRWDTGQVKRTVRVSIDDQLPTSNLPSGPLNRKGQALTPHAHSVNDRTPLDSGESGMEPGFKDRKHKPQAPTAASHTRTQATLEAITSAALPGAVSFGDPGFRHEGCPAAPAYCQSMTATYECHVSPKAERRGRVPQGRTFASGEATPAEVRWLMRHCKCSDAETLHRAWKHRVASRKKKPLPRGSKKDKYLSRWYPQWLTRIAAMLDPVQASGG
ncbi:Hypothetical predicted protein [Lecanosticta acicola]|uniref:Uncharacterized protein n=1 Tax=Lecanosticta acicola TaxID=111012 RepID=A0AAI9EFK5_9PEZI|nr:Hypothetical predicted protein [Lecanosticta acicola]